MKQGIKSWHFSDRVLLTAYAVWIAIGILVTLLHLTGQGIAAWSLGPFHLPGFLPKFVDACLAWGDPILILLAAGNTHLIVSRIWGPRPARKWFVALFLISGLIELIGTKTGFPFGPYAYTENFGPRISLLPVAIPLAWYVLLSNGLILWRAFLPGFILPIEAAATATLVTGIDWVMEPFAAKIKVYWIWNTAGGLAPQKNYIAWWIVAFLLVLLFAKSPGHQERFEPRPLFLLGTMLLLFVVTRRVYGM